MPNNDFVILRNKIETFKASIKDSVNAKAAHNTFNEDLKIVRISFDRVMNKKGLCKVLFYGRVTL